MQPWKHLPGLALALGVALAGTPALAQTPADDAWTVTNEQRIEVEGIPLTLSPDGAWIAGVGEERTTFCVWEVATLDPTCDGGFGTPITHQSIVWSPDSTAVAFSLDAPILLRDSDIYVFEVADGAVTDLTPDDPDGTGADQIRMDQSKMDAPVPIDLYPAWSPDSQELVFARTMWGSEEEPGTTLMTIPRAGGEPEEVLTLKPAEPMLIFSPIVWQADGTILFSDWRVDRSDPQAGLWRLSTEVGLDQVFPTAGSAVPGALIADVTADGTRASVVSMLNRGQFMLEPGTIYFDVDLTDGTAEPWETQFGLETDPVKVYQTGSDGLLAAPPVFSPDDAALAFVTRTVDDEVHLWIVDAAGVHANVFTVAPDPDADEAAMAGSTLGPRVEWASNGTALILSNAGIVLVTLESAVT